MVDLVIESGHMTHRIVSKLGTPAKYEVMANQMIICSNCSEILDTDSLDRILFRDNLT